MKKGILLGCFIALGMIGHNQTPANLGIKPEGEPFFEVKKQPNTAFTFGEKLTYRIHYGLLNGGNCYFEVDNAPSMVGQRPTYHITVHGKSTGLVDMMFKVRDQYESYMDVDALVPWKATKNVKEGNYTDTDFIIFDHYKRMATSRRGALQIPEGTKDLISSIYYARTLNMANAKPGDVFPITFYLDHKNYEFRFKFIGRETIDTEMGTFKALKVKPQVIEGRVFKDEEAITMWVSDDENKIPLRVQSEIWVGSLKADLIDMKGMRNPMTSKVD